MIFNIQRFSTHDGPGIRTVVFFKGCPLRCHWCSNPESQNFGPDLMFDRKLCKNFGDCLNHETGYIYSGETGIEVDWKKVNRPEILRNVCLSKALTVSGEDVFLAEIMKEIEKDRSFFLQSGGGVTLSGGEPLAQGQELDELLFELNRQKIDVSIETTLHISWKKVERCLNMSVTFLVDLKHTDPYKFEKYCRGNADLVLSNIRKLAAFREKLIIRVPVIPGFNHTFQEIKEIIDFTVSLETVGEIHFLPFHNLGSAKYGMLGMEYKYSGMKNLEAAEVAEYVAYAESVGLIAKIGG